MVSCSRLVSGRLDQFVQSMAVWFAVLLRRFCGFWDFRHCICWELAQNQKIKGN
jgi:hypothetical protein